MKYIALVLLTIGLTSCSQKVESDSQGRVFTRIQKGTPGTPDAPGKAELWQLKTNAGPGKPLFFKLMGPPPAIFTESGTL